MGTHLRLLYVCERSFAGLPGDDAKTRRCDTCSTPVHNLDAMTGEEQAQVLSRAAAERTTVCVSLAVPAGAVTSCREGQPIALPGPSDRSGAGPAGPTLPPVDWVPLAGVAVVDRVPEVVVDLHPPPPEVVVVARRHFVEPSSALAAALRELAAELRLTEAGVGDGRWSLQWDGGLTGEVHIQAETGGTRVGLTLLAPAEPRARGPGRALALASAVWVGCGIAWFFVGQLAVRLGLALTGVCGLLWLAPRVLAGRRRHEARRAARAWEERFWRALAAGLTGRRPYRSPT